MNWLQELPIGYYLLIVTLNVVLCVVLGYVRKVNVILGQAMKVNVTLCQAMKVNVILGQAMKVNIRLGWKGKC